MGYFILIDTFIQEHIVHNYHQHVSYNNLHHSTFNIGKLHIIYTHDRAVNVLVVHLNAAQLLYNIYCSF